MVRCAPHNAATVVVVVVAVVAIVVVVTAPSNCQVTQTNESTNTQKICKENAKERHKPLDNNGLQGERERDRET